MSHEIYCSQGRVCAEIDVLKIDVEDKDGGKVKITLKNRTGDTSLIQIHLQVIGADGDILTETKPENFTLPPTQEKIYQMPGVARKNSHVRVFLNLAY